MDKKYLVVCGDSFTEGHVMGEKASWAYWVSKELNLKLINLAKGGMGNEWISNKTLGFLNTEEINKDEIVVIIGWSDLSRYLFFVDGIDDESSNLMTIVPADLLQKSDSIFHDDRLKWVWNHRKAFMPFFSNISWYLYKTYQSLFYTKIYLNSFNIPFLFFDCITDNKIYYENETPYLKKMWSGVDNTDFEKVDFVDEMVSNIISKKNVDFIFDEKYINFEGKTILEWLKTDDHYKYEKGNEGHTNIIGAMEISKYIVSSYTSIYNL